jgi:CTP-dependent riboflavin kinase
LKVPPSPSFLLIGMRFRGEVVSGMSRGAYFITVYASRIKKLTGMTPYPGTLNVRLAKAPQKRIDLKVNRFRKLGVLFGEAGLQQCRLNGMRVYVIWPEKAKHEKNVVEIIYSKWLREELGLRDGSPVTLEC